MSFTITAASNPQTRGRGDCFVVEVEYPKNVRGAQTPLSVMFDNYDTTPAVTVTLDARARLSMIEDIDEGCFLRFNNAGSELIVILPLSVRALVNSIAGHEEAARIN